MIASSWEHALPSRHSESEARRLTRRLMAVSDRRLPGRKSPPRSGSASSRWVRYGTQAGLAALVGAAFLASWLHAWVWNSNLWLANQGLLPDGYVQDCASARAVGIAPLYRGFAGYREALDGDRDGIACEPSLFR